MPISPTQVKSALGGIANPVALRQAILNRLKIDPQNLTGFQGSANFDQNINDLYRSGLERSTSLNTQEGDLNRNFQQQKLQAVMDRDKALKSVAEGFAGRGMTFSTGNINAVNDVGQNYTRQIANYGQNLSGNLNSIRDQRQNLLDELAKGQMIAEQGYGTQMQDFIKQQAVASWTAETEAQQQRLQQEQQAQMIAALQANAAARAAPRTVYRPAPAPVQTPDPNLAPPPVASPYMGAPAPYRRPPLSTNYAGRMRS